MWVGHSCPTFSFCVMFVWVGHSCPTFCFMWRGRPRPRGLSVACPLPSTPGPSTPSTLGCPILVAFLATGWGASAPYTTEPAGNWLGHDLHLESTEPASSSGSDRHHPAKAVIRAEVPRRLRILSNPNSCPSHIDTRNQLCYRCLAIF